LHSIWKSALAYHTYLENAKEIDDFAKCSQKKAAQRRLLLIFPLFQDGCIPETAEWTI
jgi:hypothetical protein